MAKQVEIKLWFIIKEQSEYFLVFMEKGEQESDPKQITEFKLDSKINGFHVKTSWTTTTGAVEEAKYYLPSEKALKDKCSKDVLKAMRARTSLKSMAGKILIVGKKFVSNVVPMYFF